MHTKYTTRGRIMGEDIQLITSEHQQRLDVAVCVGACCYLKGSYDTLQELIHQADQAGIKGQLNLHATFCLEGCSQSPSVRINGEIIGGVSPDQAGSIFKSKILNRCKS